MKKKLKASFTIEAGVVVPVIMFITVTVFLMCFFIHDRAVMKSVGVFYAMESAGKETDDFGLSDEISRMLGMRLIRTKEISVSAESDGDAAGIRETGRVPAPFVFEQELNGGQFSLLAAEIDVSDLNGRRALLKYKAIIDMAEAFAGE